MNWIRTLAVAGLLTVAVAAPAAADSIAYVKDNDIWLANPDGSHQVRVTHDGTAVTPYRSPSQADDGTIAAGHGGDLVKLAQTGQVLAQFAPPTATDSTGHIIEDVPQQVAISPDGTRLAYVYSQASCPPGAPCGVRQELLYSYTDRTTPVAVFGEETNLTNPSWIDNTRVLAFGGHFHQVNVDSPGGGNDDAVHWFEDAGNEDVGDGEISRQGDRLALVRSYGDNTHIAIYHVSSGVGGSAPDAACYTGTDASLAGPSWSPDGTKLAFQDAEGIEVMPLPSVVAGDCPGASSSSVILHGATSPDWGPAAIRADAGTYTAPAGGASPSPSTKPTPPPAGPARLTVSVPRAIALSAAGRAGILVRARSSSAGRLTASARVGRRRVAAARTTASAGAPVTLRLRLSRASLGLLRRAHAKRLTVTVTLIPASGRKVTRTATARIAGPAKAKVSIARPVIARFSGTFEAERFTSWNQPRGVNLIDCHGQHYLAASGEDRTSLKTRQTFTVTVTRIGRSVTWQFGAPPSGSDPLSYGVEAHGVSTRSETITAGATGGWCGSAQTTPPPTTDCGTRLPVYQTFFSAARRKLTWSASFAQRTNERFDFYNCPLTTPKGMYAGSFPTLPAKVDTAAVFNRGKRTIVLSAAKDYGPTSTPVPNLGVQRTARGRASWKLTLTRVR